MPSRNPEAGWAIGLPLLVSGPLAMAATAEPTRPFAAPGVVEHAVPSGVGSLGQVTLALMIVLIAVFVVAWLLRQVRGIGRPANAAVNVLADIPLGPKERAVLMQVGSTQLVVGVAPGRVNLLHVMAEPVQVASGSSDESPERPSFRSLLLKSLCKS